MRRQHVLTLVAILLLVATFPLIPVHADEIDEAQAGKAVAGLLQKQLGDDPREIWQLGETLAGGGKPAIRALRKAAPQAGPAQRLAIARALLILEDFTNGLGLLRDVVSDEKAGATLKEGALRLVGEEGELEDAEWLEDQIDKTFEPRVKMAMAKALWTLNFSSKRKGKEILLAYLKSTDLDLRAEGALALGEIGAIDEAKPVLRKLRSEPTERGRSAAFLLRMLDLERAREQDLRTPLPTDPALDPDTAAKPPAGQWPLLDEIFQVLSRLYVDADKVARDKLEDAMAAGITRALDPFTSYLTPDEHAKLREGLDPTYAGVGAYVYNDPQNRERFTISRPIFGGPIYRAGLRTGDMVMSIDGTSTEGMTVEEAVRHLKGPPGTDVVVSIYRRGWDEPRPFTLKRARITIPTTAYDILPGKIGFLQILSFAQDTSREVAKVLDHFQKEGVRAIVIDLRLNSGGYLHSAVEIASQLLPRGKLVVSENGPAYEKERRHYSAGTGSHRPEWPLLVLVNAGTASAAEILAGALQVHDRAELVGTMTFGKGSVQRPWDLSQRPGEPYEDQLRDEPIRYEDLNRNNRLDPGEPVYTEPRRSGSYDPPEKFEDKNGNAKWDEGETFTDTNFNGRWDAGEPFEDKNGNGIRDPGASLKLTIAAYYLPDGRRLQRKTDIVNGRVKVSGGIEPDLEAKLDNIDFWVLQAQRKLESTPAIEEYVDKLFKKDPELLQGLSRSDKKQPEAYPGFDAFYASLDTPLEKEDVRFLLRLYVRRRVGDKLGRELVGDLVDDVQLQAAIRHLFENLGDDLEAQPELAFIAKLKKVEAADAPEGE